MLSTLNLSITIKQQRICQLASFRFKQGQMVAILGRNGCGKTLLLHTLAGLLRPAEGQIFYAAKPISQFSIRSLAKMRGILLQETNFHTPDKVVDYIAGGRFPHQQYFALPSAMDAAIIEESLTIFDLAPLRDRKITNLSGGEKQRLALATLHVQSPTIYFLDEPLNHLDLHHQINVMQHFQKIAYNHQKLVLLSLHDPMLAANFCDTVILLNDDLQVGSSHELLTTAHLSALYQHQIAFLPYKNQQLFFPTLTNG